MTKTRRIERILFRKEQMILVADKKLYSFKLENISLKLKKADKKARETYEISPSGYGIHWPLLDEDLSIEALFNIYHRESRSDRP